MSLKSLKNLTRESLKGKRVIVRVDFNVPLNKKLEITNDVRIKRAIPTIDFLVENKAKIILMSHLGRPKGQIVNDLRLTPIAKHLSRLTGKTVMNLEDCIGASVDKELHNLRDGEIALLENLRFHKEEEKNDPIFSKQLSSLADIYVDDAFGTAHRAHASTVGIAKFLPSYAGFLIEKEINVLSKLLKNPEKPFVVILGGAKVTGKIEVVQNLIHKADSILISGGMSFTALKARGFNVGNSIIEDYDLEIVRKMLKNAEEKGTKIFLPIDFLVAKNISPDAETEMVKADSIPEDSTAVDIGEETISLFKNQLRKAKTIFWNGPVGIFEIDQFAHGTNQIAITLAEMEGKAITVVGGGDSITALEKIGLSSSISYLSTGGGASLDFLGGSKLPGIEVLLEDN